MKVHGLRLLALSSFGLVGACAAEGPSGPLTVAVAPLTLPGIADVCYGLTVFNGNPTGSPDTVWSLDHICSTQYGNSEGGDITYIGTCDADSPGNNYVQLILESIETDDDEILDDQFTSLPTATPPGDGDADFINPCAEAGKCVLNFPCVENEDVLVEFNISVMRDAEQGFFDIAVNFEDVFCSAKADSCYDAGTPITLLFGDDANDPLGRDHTFVAGLACTAGPDYVNSQGNIIRPQTELLLGTPTVSCDNDVDFVLALDGEAGNNRVKNVGSGNYTLHYGIYHDKEDLDCGEASAEAFENLHVADASGRYPYEDNSAPPVTGYYATYDSNEGFWTFYAPNGQPVPGLKWTAPADNPGTHPRADNGPNVKFTAVLTRVASPGSALSCNKTFFNFAIDIANLAGQGLTNCELQFGATAQDANDRAISITQGTINDRQSVYGVAIYDDVPLTGGTLNAAGDSTPICDAHPLNGTALTGGDSSVTTQYVFGAAYGDGLGGTPASYFATNGGKAHLIGSVPQK